MEKKNTEIEKKYPDMETSAKAKEKTQKRNENTSFILIISF
jgi:hypothetical protein